MGYLAKELKPGKKEEITPVQQKVLDHSVKFSKLNKDRELKLFEEIKSLEIPRITEDHIASIVNIIPKSVPELRSIFAGSKTTVAPENLDKIQKTVDKYEK